MICWGEQWVHLLSLKPNGRKKLLSSCHVCHQVGISLLYAFCLHDEFGTIKFTFWSFSWAFTYDLYILVVGLEMKCNVFNFTLALVWDLFSDIWWCLYVYIYIFCSVVVSCPSKCSVVCSVVVRCPSKCSVVVSCPSKCSVVVSCAGTTDNNRHLFGQQNACLDNRTIAWTTERLFGWETNSYSFRTLTSFTRSLVPSDIEQTCFMKFVQMLWSECTICLANLIGLSKANRVNLRTNHGFLTKFELL